MDLQAVDRAHRIGQTRTVNIYRIMEEWGVEEKLAHRQLQKLRMEQAVINANGESVFDMDEDATFSTRETLSASEVMTLLRHGEQALQSFPGESIDGESLSKLLERQHRPLPSEDPTHETDVDVMNLGDETIELELEGASHSAPAQLDEDDDALVPGPVLERVPPPPPAFVPKEEEPVTRTSSGRAVRRPKMTYIPVAPTVVKKNQASDASREDMLRMWQGGEIKAR